MYDKESSLLWLCVFGPGFTTETVQYNGYRFVLWDLSGSDKNVSCEDKNVKYVRSHTLHAPHLGSFSIQEVLAEFSIVGARSNVFFFVVVFAGTNLLSIGQGINKASYPH